MYNEEAVAERCLQSVTDELQGLSDRFRFEVLVVDDGSDDATPAVIERFAQTHPEVRLLRHRSNFRLGQALRFAFGQSAGDYVVTFDADLSYTTDHIGRLLDAVTETGARIVIASPYMQGGKTYGIPFMRRAMSRGANWFLGLTAQEHLKTVTGLVRAYDGPFIRTLDLKAVDTDVNTEIIYKAQLLRARIEEIPAVLDWRDLGSRRPVKGFNTRLYWGTAKQLVSGFLFRPFMFFLLPGLALLLLSLGFGVWAIRAVVQTHDALDYSWVHATNETIRTRPIIFGAGTVSLIIGLQLVSLAIVTLQAKRYFEELFHLGTTVNRQVSDEPSLRQPRPTDQA